MKHKNVDEQKRSPKSKKKQLIHNLLNCICILTIIMNHDNLVSADFKVTMATQSYILFS
jgi:hypothetical protein